MSDEARLLDLLREQHTFPGAYTFRAITTPDAVDDVMAALRTAGGADLRVDGVERNPSRAGTYVALRIRCHAERAEDVLRVHAALQAHESVNISL